MAEDLANQTPVRLDVLLSLSPVSVTAEQLVVTSADSMNEKVCRSHSVGSIRDVVNSEAERRILDMVAEGGEAAIKPSSTRNSLPVQQNPLNNISMETLFARRAKTEVGIDSGTCKQVLETDKYQIVLDQ